MELPFFVEQWLVEPELNRVRGPSGIIQLEPRTMRVLNVLAETPGQVVSRDQLLSTVWTDAVVTEHSLTIAISDLRKLFEDDPKNPAIYRNDSRCWLPVDSPYPIPNTVALCGQRSGRRLCRRRPSVGE